MIMKCQLNSNPLLGVLSFHHLADLLSRSAIATKTNHIIIIKSIKLINYVMTKCTQIHIYISVNNNSPPTNQGI